MAVDVQISGAPVPVSACRPRRDDCGVRRVLLRLEIGSSPRRSLRPRSARETFDVRVSQFTTKGKDVSYEDVPVLMRDGAKVNIRLHIPPAVKARPVPVVYYRTLCLCVLRVLPRTAVQGRVRNVVWCECVIT